MDEDTQVVRYLHRHFGNDLPSGFLSFRYSRENYAVHNLTEEYLTYGPNGFSISTKGRYVCRNFSIRKTVLGPSAVFDLVHWDDLHEPT